LIIQKVIYFISFNSQILDEHLSEKSNTLDYILEMIYIVFTRTIYIWIPLVTMISDERMRLSYYNDVTKGLTVTRELLDEEDEASNAIQLRILRTYYG